MTIFEPATVDADGNSTFQLPFSCPPPYNINERGDDGLMTLMKLRHEFRMVMIEEVKYNEPSKIAGVNPIKPPMEMAHQPIFYCVHCRWPFQVWQGSGIVGDAAGAPALGAGEAGQGEA